MLIQISSEKKVNDRVVFLLSPYLQLTVKTEVRSVSRLTPLTPLRLLAVAAATDNNS